MLQNATPLRKSAPRPPDISDARVSGTAPATRNASVQILFKCPTFVETLQAPHILARCRIPCACHAKPHLNLQKWSEHVMFLRCWLGNGLRTTTACTFSTSQLPKVLRRWCALYILTWTCALRNNGAHFSTSQLAKVLRTWGVFSFSLANVLRATTACNFLFLFRPAGSAPAALAPSGATNHWKNTMNRDFSAFSRACIFFLLTLSLLWSSLFSLLFSDSSHRCFSICPYCRKFDF